MPQRRKLLIGATTVVVVLSIATCGDRVRKERRSERARADSRRDRFGSGRIVGGRRFHQQLEP